MTEQEIRKMLNILSRREREYVKRNNEHSMYQDLGFLRKDGKPFTIQELQNEYGEFFNRKIGQLKTVTSNRFYLRDSNRIFRQNLLDVAEAMGDEDQYEKILKANFKELRRMVKMGEITVFETYKTQTTGYAEAYKGKWVVNKETGKREYKYKKDKNGNKILKKVTGVNEIKANIQAIRLKRVGLK